MTPIMFLALFPEFSNVQRYPYSSIATWIALATSNLNPLLLANNLNLAIGLYTAHNLVLGQRDVAAAMAGIPGQANGVINSKSIGGVSVSYDTAASTNPDAGQWNLTSYGTRYWQLIRQAGMGGTQI